MTVGLRAGVGGRAIMVLCRSIEGVEMVDGYDPDKMEE